MTTPGIASAIFAALMVTALMLMLMLLVTGELHRWAHLKGERRHFVVMPSWRPDRIQAGDPPNILLVVGPQFYRDGWGVELVWGRVDKPRDGEMWWRHGLRFALVEQRRPRLRLRAECW